MKFRRLTADELAELEQEFVQFLAANTVTAADWVKIKTDKPERAGQLIDLFSDIVFEKILQQIEYLEYKTPQDLKTFHCQAEKMVMFGLRIIGDTTLDFTQNPEPEKMVSEILSSGAKLQLYQAEKGYQEQRELELFKLLEAGALISRDGSMFKTLEELRSTEG